ncbi:polyadenylate-binding protein-interacting protein 3-like [Pyrus ussuriensis x Pyrus communis]|uniref:Polyadenylate-binding protein-interacting protein 3-like n=1 Tax=Pyrus ussuriensis x Pyrus communis TaxID=2448454 RepID=A0A5N5GC57_9ROSA|nr:polyadenylate-binding protein-interacting protein 3-like [Pyrus ussuriensis x Pyrus communis]
MNAQQAPHHKSSTNGFGRRRGEREGGPRVENKSKSGAENHSRLTSSKSGNSESPSHDLLVNMTRCLIGHNVEVQVKNGSVYYGIFHATNAEKDFGIILKMARMIKDGLVCGQESVSKAPSKTLNIPAKELVQVIAKDVSITREGLLNEVQHGKHQELIIDSFISQSRRGELERELKPWVPDEDDPQRPELENIFDGQWNRKWDQFETNETLFGVKSTFDADLYTTKLAKGPQTKELEREALRIAREIEGEDTPDLHMAEERGIHLHVDIDEETRFSSVYRGEVVDDSGYDEDEDILLDTRNTETFGDSTGSLRKSSMDWTTGKSNNRAPSSSSFVDYSQSSESNVAPDLCRSGSYDHARHLASETLFKSFPSTAGESSEHGEVDSAAGSVVKVKLAEDNQTSKPDDSQPSLNGKEDAFEKGGLSSSATSYAPGQASSKGHEKTGYSDPVTGKSHVQTQTVNSHGRPGSSASSNSEFPAAASVSGGPGLSPSSSLGSLSSEKSTLNPHAKEFKLNPHAKSFVPSQAPVRPPSPVPDGSFYYPTNAPAVPHMPGMPVGIGVGPSFGHQPVMFNPQQGPQPYFHPNAPQYGQQMLLGHPRLVYMPNYQPEMPYKGRDY